MAENLETIQNILEEVKEEKSPEEKIRELNSLAEELRKERQNYEKRWYLADRFLRGNHFEIWRPVTNEIGRIIFPKGVNVRPIHYAIRVAEGIMNTLLASDPRWKVFPVGLSQIKDEEERKRKIENTKKIAAFFDNLFDAENLREKLSEIVWNGIKYGFGVIEIYWDGKPKFRVIDNFDILFDPTVKDIQDSPYIIKEVAVDLERVKANPNYNENRLELKEENKISGSSFKETQLKEKFGGKLAEKKVLIRECWIENPNGGWDVTHICQNKIFFEEHYNFNKPPFISWSFLPESLLQTSFVERMIPLNRALDITLAQIEAWARSVAVGRMLKQKTVNVNRILGEHGEIIEVNGPLDSIAWLKVQEIGGTVFNFLNELKALMGETAAATAAMGRVPKGAKVGYKLIESLKSAEISSIQHGVRKLEGTLERLGETTLMLIYYFGVTPIEAQYKNEFFEIVGAPYAGGFVNAIPVSDIDFGIDVSIESGLAYTTEAKRQLAIELAKAKLIDRKTALEILNIGGDTEEIAQRALEEMGKEEKIQQGKIRSVLDADDFQKLNNETKRSVLQELLGQT